MDEAGTDDERRGRWGARVVTGALSVSAVYTALLAGNRSLLVVRGRSMEPTLLAGDRLVTAPALRRWLTPGRLVVVADPANPDHLVVKRLVRIDSGRDGTTVEVHGDNPASSTDSRTWGALPVDAIRRVVACRWPDVLTRL